MKFLNFPEERQTYDYDCWAKATQYVLNYYGIDVRENLVMKIAKTTKEGTSIWGIERVVNKYWLTAMTEKMTIAKIEHYIDKKIPVIVVLQARTDKKHNDRKKDWIDGHYVVAIGYDKTKMYFEDPASIFRTYLFFKEFTERRHDRDVDGKEYYHYGIAIYGKKPQYNLIKKIHMD